MRIRTGGERLIKPYDRHQHAFYPPCYQPDEARCRGRCPTSGRQKPPTVHRLLADNVVVDRGATSSVRQQASSNRFDRYFMQLDADMFASVVNEKSPTPSQPSWKPTGTRQTRSTSTPTSSTMPQQHTKPSPKVKQELRTTNPQPSDRKITHRKWARGSGPGAWCGDRAWSGVVWVTRPW
jgi:hypothetical protein